MAAPASKTLKNLDGKWLMNKTLSDSPEPGLALQGMGWLTRKAILMASVTLHVKQFIGPPKPPSQSTEPATHIDIDQTATGGVKGTSEKRCLDNVERDHKDYLFGSVRSRSYWIATEKIGDEHLRGGWVEGDEEKSGPQGEKHLLTQGVSVENGWTATQIWGFQIINGERRYCRNITIEKDGQKVEFRLVYDWLGEEDSS